MRLSLLLLILAASIYGSGFWYTTTNTVCNVPIRYRIGAIDQRFGTTEKEIRQIAQRAEEIWENSLNTELFIFDEDAKLAINLIFDERQENTQIEAEFREDIKAKEGMNESVAKQYENLIYEFRILKKQYESRVITYETNLRQYNDEVTKWNDTGGAPSHILQGLKENEVVLTKEQDAIEALTKKIHSLVTDLNRIGARGNSIITDYNKVVEEYNERFNDGHEFAQGDFESTAINIYQFDSEKELTIVLAHEFGHSLSLDHVSNERSIMYRLMSEQQTENTISLEDREEYVRVCEHKSPQSLFFGYLRSLL